MKPSFEFLFLLLLSSFILTYSTNAFGSDKILKSQKVKNQFFVENTGEWSPEVLFLSRINGVDVWITRRGITYDFYKLKRHNYIAPQKPTLLVEELFKQEFQRQGHIVEVNLVGANINSVPNGKGKYSTYYNYLVGNDPKKWKSHVGLYQNVTIENIYPRIDLRYYFDKGYLRYDYIIHPGANISQLRLEIEGAYSSWVNEKGELVFETLFGNVIQQDIYAYQIIDGEKLEINAKWQQSDNHFILEVGEHYPNYDIIIDPLVYSTFIGGGAIDEGTDIAIDGSGYAYIVGATESADYPTTTGVYTTSFNGYLDVFVTKLNPEGSQIIFSTFLGGNKLDGGLSIACDTSKNIFITGFTKSSNFPVSSNAFQKTIGSKDTEDVFVTKLNPDGSSLLYSTYIGGKRVDIAKSLDIDINGNAYVTGFTSSEDFPTTAGAFDTSLGGGEDLFVVKLNASGSDLVYSSFLGGGLFEQGSSIAVDSKGYAYVAGVTFSKNYPTTPGAFDATYTGNLENFVTKLNTEGTGLVYSTFLGGNNPDGKISLAIDSIGNAFVCGTTTSGNYPTTEGAYDRINEGGFEIFVTKLNPQGSSLLYSTFLGGADKEFGWDIAIDKRGNAYITGSVWFTDTTDFPATECSFNREYKGAFDCLVAILNSSGSQLLYSALIGGLGNEYGLAIATDSIGNAYLTGDAWSGDFPVTEGSFDHQYNGNFDAFALKLNLCCPLNPAIEVQGKLIICKGDTVVLKAQPENPYYTYEWSNGDKTISTIVTDGGYYTLQITNEIGCSEMAGVNIDINPTVLVSIDTVLTKVGNENVALNIRCKVASAGSKTISDLSLHIAFDASAFLPAENQSSIEQNYVDNNGVRHLVLRFKNLNLKTGDTIMFQLLGTALLGNNKDNIINLFDITTSDIELCPIKSSGMIVLDSVCVFELRGVEIFNPSNFNISTNPVTTDDMEIVFEGNEQGTHTLSIYNINGVLLESRTWNNEMNGKKVFNFDSKAYPNGFYFVVLKTPWNSVAKPLLIMR